MDPLGKPCPRFARRIYDGLGNGFVNGSEFDDYDQWFQQQLPGRGSDTNRGVSVVIGCSKPVDPTMAMNFNKGPFGGITFEVYSSLLKFMAIYGGKKQSDLLGVVGVKRKTRAPPLEVCGIVGKQPFRIVKVGSIASGK